MLHIHYSKLDKGDMRRILQKKFDPESNKAEIDICRRRQESVRKNVVATNFMWGTAFEHDWYWMLVRPQVQLPISARPPAIPLLRRHFLWTCHRRHLHGAQRR